MSDVSLLLRTGESSIFVEVSPLLLVGRWALIGRLEGILVCRWFWPSSVGVHVVCRDFFRSKVVASR